MRVPIFLSLCSALASLQLAATPAVAAESAARSLRYEPGDRVVLVGDAFVERMADFGYLECLVTTRLPHLHLTFRNVGWSGDTAGGLARAVFGKPAAGYRRLLKDVATAKPSLILIAYGANEAHAGSAGFPEFERQLTRLLDDLAPTKARLALVTPTRRAVVTGLPDPAGYNASLKHYVQRIRYVAKARKLPLIDQFDLPVSATLKPNGVHFSRYGYWRHAFALADRLGATASPWSLEIDVRGLVYDAVNTQLHDLTQEDKVLRFTTLDRYLPPPPAPRYGRAADGWRPDPGVVRIAGLTDGQYELQLDGKPVARGNERQWARGLTPRFRGGEQQAEQLRQAIVAKNTLFFHRYRPQNETYLFLFRKHEQGNNAVEIPRFDPLIEKAEAAIARLVRPRVHRWELRPVR